MKKPAKKRRSTAAKPTADPADEMLQILRNPNLKLRRLFMMAKHCLKNGLHIDESLGVLRRVVVSGEMAARQKDLALRLLNKHAHARNGPRDAVMRLPESWKGLIGVVAGKVEWVADKEWDRLNRGDKKRWLPPNAAPPSLNLVTGGRDDD